MTTTIATPAASARPLEPESASSQYLTFTCADQEYGVDILRVQEIRGWSRVTRLPEAQHDVMGVLDLRGTIIPVVSLRVRFCLDPKPVDAATVVIVLRVTHEDGFETVGICVDGVSDVHSVNANDIMASTGVNGCAGEGVSGLVTLDGKTVILLNIDCLFGRARAN